MIFMPRRPASPFKRSYRLRIGYEGEYYLMKKFTTLNKPGYYAVRTPGSGTGKTYKPDLLVVEDGELYAIEVKSTNRASIYVRPDQLERLLRFTELFRIRCPHCGGEFNPKPVLAVRFLGRGWIFREVGAEDTVHVSLESAEASGHDKAIRDPAEVDGYAPRREAGARSGGDERDRAGDSEGLRRTRGEARTGGEARKPVEGSGVRDKVAGRRGDTYPGRPNQAGRSGQGGEGRGPKTRRA